MNKIKTLLVSSLLSISASALASDFNADSFFMNPYVAVEGAWRHLPWETGYGDRHFKNEYSNVNFILGAQFHRHFALEGGYQSTDLKQKQMYYFGDGNNYGEPALGFLLPALAREQSTHIAESQLRGWHLNLLGLWPLFSKTTLYASAGAAWMRFYVSTVPIIPGREANLVSHWQSDRKAKFRLGLGIKQMITDHFGARLFWNWENTHLAGRTLGTGITVPEQSSDYYTAKSKSSSLIGLGFYYQLNPNPA